VLSLAGLQKCLLFAAGIRHEQNVYVKLIDATTKKVSRDTNITIAVRFLCHNFAELKLRLKFKH